jgi:hypothetical protein
MESALTLRASSSGSDLDCSGAPDLEQEIDIMYRPPVSFFYA